MAILNEEQKEELLEGLKDLTEDVRETMEEVTEKVSKRAKPVADVVTKKAENVVKAAKKAVLKPEVYVQFGGKEVATSELVAQAKAMYKEAGNRAAVRDLRVYVKPEEAAAYVIINDEFSAKIDL